MDTFYFYAAGTSGTFPYVIENLSKKGCVFLPKPCPAVTHLLLPVPSMESENTVKGGAFLPDILSLLPSSVTVIGGNLPELAPHPCWDLLCDPGYLEHNAGLTAQCALQLATKKLSKPIEDCSTLVIGWGRIGKHLAALLKGMHSDVTIAARKECHQAAISSLGYGSISTHQIPAEKYHLIFNTAPAMILPHCPGQALKIDLASQRGLGGDDVIWARGLPGQYAPEASGAYISQWIWNKLQQEGQQ